MKKTKKNILLISIDTLRADVGYSGKFKEIEDLRKAGVTFLNTVSSAPLTPVSHSTVFTGLQPYNHGVRHLFKEKLKDETPTLAEILKSNGYETGAIVSCPGMNAWYNLNKGFDHYDDEIPMLPDGSDPLETVDVKLRGSALKRGEAVADKAYSWLKKHSDENYFLFMHFFDAHWPYEAPKKYGGDNVYEQEVAYSSYHLGQFLEKAKKEGMLENTVVICFSDHGEDLDGMYENDKGGDKLGHPEELGHGCLLYNQTQKVVLIINDQDLPKATDIDQQVRLVDITPTVLDLLNLDASNYDFDGVSLLPIIKDEKDLGLVGYSETYYPEEQNEATNNKFPEALNKKSIIMGNKHKIIMNEGGKPEIYDLEDDPNEKKNLL